jgi:hypothetical protein
MVTVPYIYRKGIFTLCSVPLCARDITTLNGMCKQVCNAYTYSVYAGIRCKCVHCWARARFLLDTVQRFMMFN